MLAGVVWAGGGALGEGGGESDPGEGGRGEGGEVGEGETVARRLSRKARQSPVISGGSSSSSDASEDEEEESAAESEEEEGVERREELVEVKLDIDRRCRTVHIPAGGRRGDAPTVPGGSRRGEDEGRVARTVPVISSTLESRIGEKKIEKRWTG